jgi:mRNA interferase RelE/StbE
MKWAIEYIAAARKDFNRLDHSQQIQVVKAIEKVALNPLPGNEGGYGKPLGNRKESYLAGCFKIKLVRLGIRVVYTLVRENNMMKIIVISMRDDNQVYKIAQKRIS